MEYAEVSEIAKRVHSISELYFETYSKFQSIKVLNRRDAEELLNNLYHVVHATEYIHDDDSVLLAKEQPMDNGAGIIISKEIYATYVAEEGEMLRMVIRSLSAREEGYFYPNFKFKHDMNKIKRHQKKLMEYGEIVNRDYLQYILSLGKEQE